VLTRRALRDANFTSTCQLEHAIDVWTSGRNDSKQTLVRTKIVDHIITKVARQR